MEETRLLAHVLAMEMSLSKSLQYAMEETRLVQKLLVKLWSQFELLCGMPANVKNKNPMDKLGR